MYKDLSSATGKRQMMENSSFGKTSHAGFQNKNDNSHYSSGIVLNRCLFTSISEANYQTLVISRGEDWLKCKYCRDTNFDLIWV
jgi:hypothetical protein